MDRVWHCPRCGRELEATGDLGGDGGDLPVYQCDACYVAVDLFGEPFVGSLTFCVGPDGRPFDPASPSGELPPAAPAPAPSR
jgi:hypothetical protein